MARSVKVWLTGCSCPKAYDIRLDGDEWGHVPTASTLSLWERAAAAMGWKVVSRNDAATKADVLSAIADCARYPGPAVFVWAGHGLRLPSPKDPSAPPEMVLATLDCETSKPESWLQGSSLYTGFLPRIDIPTLVVLDACYTGGWLSRQMGAPVRLKLGEAEWRLLPRGRIIGVAAAPEDLQAWYEDWPGLNKSYLRLSWAMARLAELAGKTLRQRTLGEWLRRASRRVGRNKMVVESTSAAIEVVGGSLVCT